MLRKEHQGFAGHGDVRTFMNMRTEILLSILLSVLGNTARSEEPLSPRKVDLFSGGWVTGYSRYYMEAIQFEKDGTFKDWMLSDDGSDKDNQLPSIGNWSWQSDRLEMVIRSKTLKKWVLYPHERGNAFFLSQSADVKDPESEGFFQMATFDSKAPFWNAVGHPMNREEFLGEWTAISPDATTSYLINLADDGTGFFGDAVYYSAMSSAKIVDWKYERDQRLITGLAVDELGKTNSFSLQTRPRELTAFQFEPFAEVENESTNLVFIKVDQLELRWKEIRQAQEKNPTPPAAKKESE